MDQECKAVQKDCQFPPVVERRMILLDEQVERVPMADKTSEDRPQMTSEMMLNSI